MPLTPTLSPQAGRGGREIAASLLLPACGEKMPPFDMLRRRMRGISTFSGLVG
jgi:hypothetical protein